MLGHLSFAEEDSEYLYTYSFGENNYFILLEAGKRDKLTNDLDTMVSAASEYAIPFTKPYSWSNAGTEQPIPEENWPLETTIIPPKFVEFCLEDGKMSGSYHYNSKAKTVTFKIKLDLSGSKQQRQTELQYISLGLSEDEKWGDALMFSCDSHAAISAFGHWKVIIFDIKRYSN